jgi:phosphate transport system substrate-binding protein
VVESSVGSGGGVRAVLDGAVDIGMVARPLSPAEKAQRLVVVPVARDVVVLAVNGSVSIDSLTNRQVIDLLTGRVDVYPTGASATVFWRDKQDSAPEALERLVPGLIKMREEIFRRHRRNIVYHDDTMGVLLATTPGAIGPYSLGAMTVEGLPLKALAIDGLRPSLESLASGQWKATRELSCVVRQDRLERVTPFLDFIASQAGQTLIRTSGYLPASRAHTP